MISSLFSSSIFIMFIVFLKVGFFFFGGGFAVIPLLQKELVVNHHFLTNSEFLQGMALSQCTPGPVAIIATFAGYRILGVIGALVATFAMFFPGVALMFFISKNYKKIQNSTFAKKMLNTITPVIIGFLIATVWQLGGSVIHNPIDWVICLASLFLLLRYSINPVLLILASGLLGVFFY